MQISKLKIENFRGINSADFDFDGHTLLVGGNNAGKSTICEALELALGPDRQARFPVVEEYDFYNAEYLDAEKKPKVIRVEVLLTDLTPTVRRQCLNYTEHWVAKERRLLGKGELSKADDAGVQRALRLLTIARYNPEEDEFEAGTYYASKYDPENENDSRVPRTVRRSFGFLYLRTLRTGSRALSLERGSLLDVILRIQSLQTGIWEHVRDRLENLAPPIDEGAKNLKPVLDAIETRLAEYIRMAHPGNSTRLFVSQLTREHLRKTLSFFVAISPDQKPVPFQDVGTGTLNTLVLALLSFIAELKEENVIFAMEEPEIALPPHTQRRIAEYLLTKTTQCFVTSHSPYVIESFEPERLVIVRRDEKGVVRGKAVSLSAHIKAKSYRRHVRRTFAEAMLGCGVVVAEGESEVAGLKATANAMEKADPKLYPFDLAGVSIITPDGDGAVAEFGRFFKSLELPVYAFLDKKKRPEKDSKALEDVGFDILFESLHAGMELLLAQEVPLSHQWAFLEQLRANGTAPHLGIPSGRPKDETAIRNLTYQALKDSKGLGRTEDLIFLCAPSELPISLRNFLSSIYAAFPRPKITPVKLPANTSLGTAPQQDKFPVAPSETPVAGESA